MDNNNFNSFDSNGDDIFETYVSTVEGTEPVDSSVQNNYISEPVSSDLVSSVEDVIEPIIIDDEPVSIPNNIETDNIDSIEVENIEADPFENKDFSNKQEKKKEKVPKEKKVKQPKPEKNKKEPKAKVEKQPKPEKAKKPKAEKVKQPKAEKVKQPKPGKNKKPMVQKDKKSNGAKFFASIKIKIAASVSVAVMLSLIVTYFVTMSGFKTGIDSLVKTNMVTAVSTYNTLLEDTILLTKNNLTASNLSSLYKEAGLAGVETSEISLINEEGIYTYNRSNSLIGTKVELEKLLQIVQDHSQKKKIEPDVFDATIDGKEYYVGYYACENGWLLVCTAEKDELYQTYYDVKQVTIIGAGITIIVFAVLAYLISLTITKPINKLTLVIHKTAGLDFTKNDDLEKLCTGKDETSVMSRALKEMQFSIKDVIERIHAVSNKINDNSHSLNDLASLVKDNSTDNSATTQQLAAGMEESAASSTRVNENVTNILHSIDSISGKTKDGQQLALDIMAKASKLKSDTVLASDNGKRIFENVRKETAVAIEKSKDVDKINSLTKTILEISEQTNLLSLNASIEAARAGEAGRGFAVVAQEIGHLANQSASTVEIIGNIVKDVTAAVNNLANCIETTLNTLEDRVLSDYDGFISVSDEYNSDADVFEGAMKDIHKSINELEKSTELIAEAISSINATINESSIGVSDIAEKTSDIVELTIKTNEMVDESVSHAKELNNIVEIFKL